MKLGTSILFILAALLATPLAAAEDKNQARTPAFETPSMPAHPPATWLTYHLAHPGPGGERRRSELRFLLERPLSSALHLQAPGRVPPSPTSPAQTWCIGSGTPPR